MTILGIDDKLIAAYPGLKRILAATGMSRTQILMVADGDIHFGPAAFGLSELLKALGRGAAPEGALSITTAYRGAKKDEFVADDYEFEFKAGSLAKYSQLWLFGHLPQSSKLILKDEELKVISDFMNDGGGVFATGDHEDLGFALCGRVPRVRSMRKWCKKGAKDCEDPAPPGDGRDRLDTLREGHDVGFQISDQSDNLPQIIFPKLYEFDKDFIPHDLLSNGNETIRVLPDHMHEGNCVVPTGEKALEKRVRFADGPEFDEYPLETGKADRLSPEVIAVAVSSGGRIRDRAKNQYYGPVDPRCFGAICVYDGRHANMNGHPVGRVVVDASFHHFLNINLNGTGAFKGRGFYDKEGRPTEDYEAIKRYYFNIAEFLVPPSQKLLHYARILISLRFMFPLIEEIRPDEELSLDNLLDVGRLTRGALSELLSPAEAVECARTIHEALVEENALKALVNLRPALPRASGLSRLLNTQALTDMFLGLPMLFVARHLPGDVNEAGEEIEKMALSNVGLMAQFKDGIRGLAAQLELGPAFERLSASLGEASKVLGALKQPEADQPEDV